MAESFFHLMIDAASAAISVVAVRPD